MRISLLGVVASALYYNPPLTLSLLEERGWTQSMFTGWFQLTPKLCRYVSVKGGVQHLRMHDKKISILSLTSLLSLPVGSLPQIVQAGMKQILEAILSLQVSLENQKKRTYHINTFN